MTVWVLSLKRVIVSVVLVTRASYLSSGGGGVRYEVEEENAFPIWCNLRRHSKRLPVDETIDLQGISGWVDEQDVAVEESGRWL